LNIDAMAGPLASSGPQLCQTVNVTGSAGTAVGGTAVAAGAEVAAGAAVAAGAGGLPQALITMEVTTSRAISMEIVFLFILIFPLFEYIEWIESDKRTFGY
jgi:hypothetical protein